MSKEQSATLGEVPDADYVKVRKALTAAAEGCYRRGEYELCEELLQAKDMLDRSATGRDSVLEEAALACEAFDFNDRQSIADPATLPRYCAAKIRTLKTSVPSETLQTEVLTYERDRAQAMYENAMRFLTRIYGFLNPPFVTANGKTYSFQNPDANETLQILSDAIRAIPEDLRSVPSATPCKSVPLWLWDDIVDFVNDHVDVRDGEDGVPQANSAMHLASRIETEVK